MPPLAPLVEVLTMIGVILKYTWWFLLPIGLFSIFRPLWKSYVTNILYLGQEVQMTLLKIEIPKEMIPSMKAMENVLAGFLAAGRTITFYEETMTGRLQALYSLEIVGEEGNVSFYVLTPKRTVSLVQRSFYSQFPGIEIKIAKEDYFDRLPPTIPDNNWNMWGAKMILAEDDCKPINTYPMMEDKIEGEIIDPLSIMFEAMGNLGPGEFLIYQIHIALNDGKWRDKCKKFIEEILKKYNIGSLADAEEGTMMKILPPNEMELVKAVSAKASKLGFDTQIVLAYIARREAYNDIASSSVTGAMNMFASSNNIFVTDKYYTTTTKYLFSKKRGSYRRRRLFKLMKDRDIHTANVFNIEELATMFHFPPPLVKMPAVQRLESKTAPAPTNLPIGE